MRSMKRSGRDDRMTATTSPLTLGNRFQLAAVASHAVVGTQSTIGACLDHVVQTIPSDRAILCKQWLSLLQVGCQPLSHLRTREPEHLQRGGGVEQRTVNAKPIVESVLGPANGALGTVDEI